MLEGNGQGNAQQPGPPERSETSASEFGGPGFRKVVFGKSVPQDQRGEFTRNDVVTSRYTPLNFIPKNLFEQFHEVANCYFLLICILEAIGPISTTEGVPYTASPLVFIIAITAVRAAIEDYRRHQADYTQNSKEFQVLNDKGEFEKRPSRDLKVGDIVKLLNTEGVPADICCIHSARDKGLCYVETKNLDGETNLKIKQAVEQPANPNASAQGADAIGRSLEGTIRAETPNDNFDVFVAQLEQPSGRQNCDGTNLLLRGTVVRNVPWIIGVIIYTGAESKVRLGAKANFEAKKSRLMRSVNKYVLGQFGLLFVMCTFACIYYGIWAGKNQDDLWWLLDVPQEEALGVSIFKKWFTLFLVCAQLVPISLQVSTEFIKTFQAVMMNLDILMYDEEKDLPLMVRSAGLNEDLGQVEYVLSDKTGTMTRNSMEFRVAVIGTKKWGTAETEIAKRVKERKEGVKIVRPPYTSLVDKLLQTSGGSGGSGKGGGSGGGDTMNFVLFDQKPELMRLLKEGNSAEAKEAHDYLLALTLCHSFEPMDESEEESAKNTPVDTSDFPDASPDERALLCFAKYMEYDFISRGPSIVNVHGEKVVYFNLALLDFNSKRKRMSVIVHQADTDRVLFISKGANTEVIPLCAKKPTVAFNDTIEQMCIDGLRTMVVAQAEVNMKWFDEWKEEWEKADSWDPSLKAKYNSGKKDNETTHSKGECSDNCPKCCVMEKMERDAGMRLLGATGLEDRLQDLVPETIADLLAARVNVMMVTGDARSTAKNIALAVNLIDPDMEHHNSSKSRLIEVTGMLHSVTNDRDVRERMFHFMDLNEDGFLDQEEVHAMFDHVRMQTSEEELKKKIEDAFREFDFNGDNKIDIKEFHKLMESDMFRVDKLTSVEYEIHHGLEHVKECEAQGKGDCSLVIESAAFKELYGVVGAARPGSVKDGKPTKDAKIEPDKDTLRRETMRTEFFELAGRCKSVVACRFKPDQKAKMVTEIKTRNNAVTLAIGDGNNDEQMIIEADVGVGIAGVEGSGAVNASDYAIAQFRYLHDLLFVHGRWSYRRISIAVEYIFYKSAMVVFVMFCFGFYSAFTGQVYFHPMPYLFFNVMFTALPVILFGVIDQDIERNLETNEPLAYRAFLCGRLFNGKLFVLWIWRAVISGNILFFFPAFSLGYTVFHDGHAADLWILGLITFFATILVANFRMMIESPRLTSLHFAIVGGSIVLSVIVLLIISAWEYLAPQLFQVQMHLLADGTCWLTLLLTVATPLILEFGHKSYLLMMRPSVSQLLLRQDAGLLDDETKAKIESLTQPKGGPHAVHQKSITGPTQAQLNMRRLSKMQDSEFASLTEGAGKMGITNMDAQRLKKSKSDGLMLKRSIPDTIAESEIELQLEDAKSARRAGSAPPPNATAPPAKDPSTPPRPLPPAAASALSQTSRDISLPPLPSPQHYESSGLPRTDCEMCRVYQTAGFPEIICFACREEQGIGGSQPQTPR